MANVWAIHSVGNSVVTFLRNSYPQQIDGQDMPACSFELVSGGQLAGEIDETTRITLYLYRVTLDEHSRQNRRSGASSAKSSAGRRDNPCRRGSVQSRHARGS